MPRERRCTAEKLHSTVSTYSNDILVGNQKYHPRTIPKYQTVDVNISALGMIWK